MSKIITSVDEFIKDIETERKIIKRLEQREKEMVHIDSGSYISSAELIRRINYCKELGIKYNINI